MTICETFRFSRYNADGVSFSGVPHMAITIEAVYENGVLKPDSPLPLKEHERVRVVIVSGPTWVERTAGMMGFTGTQEEADYFAMSPELEYPPDGDDE
jgi:predicted DNA-binding antitoxin AbrB/MazE fold protein